MAEFHPVVWMFDNDFKTIIYRYFKSDAIVETQKGTYVDKVANITVTDVSWNHSLSAVINALIQQGLHIQAFNEYDYSPYNCFNNMIEVAPKKYRIVHLKDYLPMVYALKATKKSI